MSEIIDHIVSKFGSQTALAAAIDSKQSTVAQWKRRGSIPSRWQVDILKAAQRLGVDLKPADFFPSTSVKDRAA